MRMAEPLGPAFNERPLIQMRQATIAANRPIDNGPAIEAAPCEKSFLGTKAFGREIPLTFWTRGPHHHDGE